MLHKLTIALLSVSYLLPAAAARPLPRLAEPANLPAAAVPWPPLPEQGASDADAAHAGHGAAARVDPRGGYGDLPLEAVPAVPGATSVSSRAGEEGEDEGVDWQIGQGRRVHANHDLSLTFGVLPANIAGGVWWGFPLGRHGLIRGLNDGFFLEFGALLMGSGLWGDERLGQFDILPALGVRWDFYLTRMVTVFGTAKLGPRLGISPRHRVFPDPIFAIGTRVGLARRAQLRFEIGYPQGFTVGLALPLGTLTD